MFLYTTSSFINHVAFVWLTDSGVHSFFSEPFSLFGFFFRFFTDFQSLFFLLFLCKLFFLFIFLVNQQFFSDLLFLLFSDWFRNLFWNPYLSWDNLFHSCFCSFFCRIFWIFAVIAVYLPLIFISFAFLLSCSLQASLFTYQSIRSLYKGSALFLFLLQLLQISLSSFL